MAKKKKGIGASFRQQVEQVPVVQQKAPRTISTNVSTGGGGLGSSFRSATKTATQKAEEERSARMRQGLSKTFSSVVRASFNNQRNVQPTTVKKGLYSNLRNQLAPVKHNADYTRSQQTKFLNTDLQRKGLNTPMSQLMAGKTNVGVEQGKALRAGMPSGYITESWRTKPVFTPKNWRVQQRDNFFGSPVTKENAFDLRADANRIDRSHSQAELDARKKYGYSNDFEDYMQNRVKNSGKIDRFDPSNGKITTPLPAFMNPVMQNQSTAYMVGKGLADRMRWSDIKAGALDSASAQEIENVAKNAYGFTPDEDLRAKIEAQRSTLGYGTGMAAGQLAQYALTRGALNKLGVVGKGAKATETAAEAFRKEMAIDQAASLPLNVIDAMKEDNLYGIINRFGINQGLDLVFGAFTEGISIKRNPLYQNAETKHIAAKEARQAGDNAAANALDQSARRDLGAISNAELDEARNDIVARVVADDVAQPRVEQPNVRATTANAPKKERQFDLIQRSNPMNDDVHTGIRSVDDVKTFDEALSYDGWQAGDDLTPDFTSADIERALNDGKITIYSSKEITDGSFVTPSRMEAQSYAGGGDVYSKTVDIDDVAWIDGTQGQYAKVAGTPRAEVPNEPVATPAAKTTAEEPKVEVLQEKVETPRDEAKPKEEPKADTKTKAQAEQPKAKVSNSASDEEIDRLVREQTKEMYDKMSTKELNAELRRLEKNPTVTPDVEGAGEIGVKEAMDPDEVAERTDIINEILAERGASGTTNRSVKAEKAQPKAKAELKAEAKAEEPKAEDAAKEEVFVSEEQVDKAFNDAIRKRSYRFETLRAYPRSGDMRIIIGDRVYDERGFKRLIREDLERTNAQVNEAINARAAKVGKQKASAEKPKTEPKVKPQVEEPKKRNQVNGILNNEEPKAKANATEEPRVEPKEDNRTWQEHAREDYKTGKQRAEGVKKGKIPSRENGEVVNAIKRLKETKDFADIKDVLDRGVKDGLYNRKIKHLDEGIDNAIKEIEEDPEKVINEILEYHPNGAKANDVPADAVPWVMKGYALCKWADQNGMKALKEDIAATMAKAQSTGGSILRAGQVFTVMADSKTQRDIVADFVEKMQTKYAKRLGDHKLTVPEDLLKKLDDATTEAEKSKILDDISVHVWNQVPQSFFDAMSGLRIVSMLANTTTMIRNVASNVAFAGVREVDKTINTAMEATAEKLGKIDREHRSHTIYNHFSKENRKIQAFWYNDYGKNNNVIKGQSRWNEGGGALNVDIRHENARHYGVKAGGGKKGGLIGGASSGIEAVRKVTSFLMDKGDEIFLAPAYADAATQMMVVRGWSIDDLTPVRIQEIRDYATDVAQKATYRDPSDAAMALAKWGHWQKGDGGFRLLRAVLVGGIQPFKKTPINIGKRSVEYSPLGFAKGVYDIGKAVHAGDSKAVNKAITELSKGTTGTGLVVAGYLLAQQGLVNAKLPTDDEGYLRKDLGEQDYALTLNGKSRTLQWAAPGAVPILAGATLYDQIRQRGWNSLVHPAALVSVLSKSADPLLEMSFMQSYMDIADVTDDVKDVDKLLVGFEQIGLSYAAQFIPSILGKVANMVDPVRRDTSSQATDPYEKALERFINKSVINKIPNVGKAFGKEWGSASLPAYIDYKGDEQKTEDIKDRIIENFISPWYTKDIKNDPVAKEVIKVNKASDENILLSSSMGNGKHELKLDGKTINLDSHEMEQYKRLKGKANYNNVKKLMNSAEYKSMEMSEKGKAIKQEEDAAKLEAKQQTLLKMGKDEWKVYTDDFSGRKTEYQDAKDADLKAKQYYDYMTTKDWDLDESGKPVKSELVLYLNKQDDLSDEQRAVIFSKLASGNTKNPYEDGTAHTTDWQAEYDKYLAKKNKDKDGSSSSKSRGGKKGRSGRRSGGGGSGSSKTKARAKTASEKRFAALQKMKAPTTGKGIEALSQGAKGLTKAQKKALLKLMQKKLEV